MNDDLKKHKELSVVIRMNGRRSARTRRLSPTKFEITKLQNLNISSTEKLLLSPTKLYKNVSPRIDNKGLKSPARAPRIIQSWFHNNNS